MSVAESWDSVDEYLAGRVVPADEALVRALRTSAEAGLPEIQVSATQGRFLTLLARMIGARRVLEIGTLGGYSGICFCRGLGAGGRLVTLEVDPVHAEVARANLDRAGCSEMAEVRLGDASETLAEMAERDEEVFDLVFIDADKQRMAEYFHASLELSRPGTVIVADNVVRGGAVVDPDRDDPAVQGVRRFFDAVNAEPRAEATALQTVGSKGYDGFALIVVRER
ncbi:MAG: O-methyltransferase [Planctomycetota bacterium]